MSAFPCPYFISVDEAMSFLDELPFPQNTIHLPLAEAASYQLAEDVYALVMIPPFHQSAVDGYAIRWKDFYHKALHLQGEIQAGSPAFDILAEHAVAVYTGAPIPAGADTVIMQEDCVVHENQVRFQVDAIPFGANVRKAGEQTQSGDCILSRGTRITPAAMAFAASCGISEVKVFQKPRVSCIISGNELQTSALPLQAGKIFESNSYYISTVLKQWGAELLACHFIQDDANAFEQIIQQELSNMGVDVLIISGGISVGKYDFTWDTCIKSGITPLFYKVKQKPGKPFMVGYKNDKTIFALPGNPASVAACMEMYIQRYFQMPILTLHLPLLENYTKKGNLRHFLKARIEKQGVRILSGQESYKLTSLSEANAWVILHENQQQCMAGELVEVQYMPI